MRKVVQMIICSLLVLGSMIESDSLLNPHEEELLIITSSIKCSFSTHDICMNNRNTLVATVMDFLFSRQDPIPLVHFWGGHLII